MKAVFTGSGYIGLPTLVVAASKGIKVIGVDVNHEVVNTINRSEIHITEIDLDKVLKQVSNLLEDALYYN